MTFHLVANNETKDNLQAIRFAKFARETKYYHIHHKHIALHKHHTPFLIYTDDSHFIASFYHF